MRSLAGQLLPSAVSPGAADRRDREGPEAPGLEKRSLCFWCFWSSYLALCFCFFSRNFAAQGTGASSAYTLGVYTSGGANKDGLTSKDSIAALASSSLLNEQPGGGGGNG